MFTLILFCTYVNIFAMYEKFEVNTYFLSDGTKYVQLKL